MVNGLRGLRSSGVRVEGGGETDRTASYDIRECRVWGLHFRNWQSYMNTGRATTKTGFKYGGHVMSIAATTSY